jgi:hypothetical protein
VCSPTLKSSLLRMSGAGATTCNSRRLSRSH